MAFHFCVLQIRMRRHCFRGRTISGSSRQKARPQMSLRGGWSAAPCAVSWQHPDVQNGLCLFSKLSLHNRKPDNPNSSPDSPSFTIKITYCLLSPLTLYRHLNNPSHTHTPHFSTGSLALVSQVTELFAERSTFNPAACMLDCEWHSTRYCLCY